MTTLETIRRQLDRQPYTIPRYCECGHDIVEAGESHQEHIDLHRGIMAALNAQYDNIPLSNTKDLQKLQSAIHEEANICACLQKKQCMGVFSGAAQSASSMTHGSGKWFPSQLLLNQERMNEFVRRKNIAGQSVQSPHHNRYLPTP